MKIPLTFMMKKYGSEELREILMYLFSRSDIKEITYKQFVSKIVLWVNYLNCEKTLSNLITKPEESMEILKGVDTIKQTNTNHQSQSRDSSLLLTLQGCISQRPL